MSTTRLVILGAVKIFAPVTGYALRRELGTWEVGRWSSLHPGSVYHALATAGREGWVRATGEPAGGTARTAWSLTPAGEEEFARLLHEALWDSEEWDQQSLYVCLAFLPLLSREEWLTALRYRISQIAVHRERLRNDAARAGSGALPFVPLHARASLELADAQLGGVVDWAADLIRRLEDGEYRFTGEELRMGIDTWDGMVHDGRAIQI